MPPKPPLLITSTWSPARASAAIGVDQRVEVVEHGAPFAPSGASAPAGVPAEVAPRSRTRGRRAREAAGQRVLHHAQLHRVRARLEHREDARAARPCARRPAMRRRDRRRVVREVVVDGDAAHRAAHLEPALDAAGIARAPRGRRATGTPAWRAAAIAASAFSWLCPPSSAEARACPAARRRAGSAPSSAIVQSGPVPGTSAAPKRSTGVQQPRASTRARLASPPLTTSSPLPGTVRTR